MPDNYKICTRCIMDTTACDIQFDTQARCNYCTEFIREIDSADFNKGDRQEILNYWVQKIRHSGLNKRYDCVVGVSGGLDSSYALYITKKLGLRPFAVHLDNGWNSTLAVTNIENLCKNLKVNLYTHVIDWDEFKDLQRAFFKANVVDIEILTDHAISAILFSLARKNHLHFILAGTNTINEGFRIPPGWAHFKGDWRNIKRIYRRYGTGKTLKTYPRMDTLDYFINRVIHRIKWISILDYVPFTPKEAAAFLERETGWVPYEKKHYESVFTRFYQGYILPKKFGVDKRRMHYSNLIATRQMTRGEALDLMLKPPYDNPQLLADDKEFVLKKLGFSHAEFEEYIKAKPTPHMAYGSEEKIFRKLISCHRSLMQFWVKFRRKN